MTLDGFVKKYDGQFVEVAGSSNAKNQCVDLANAYLREVCGLPIVEWTNAADFPKKCTAPNYQYIKNSATGFPPKGSLVIWSSKDGIGHIAVGLDGSTATKLISFDQNWPVGTPCHIQNHTYTGTNYNVAGWLIPVVKQEDDMTEEQKRILDFLVGKTEGDVRQAFGALADLPNLTKEIEALKNSQKTLEERIAQLEADAKANNDLILDWQKKVSSANSTISKLQAEIKTQSDEKNQWKNRYEQALKEQVNKYTGWPLIKMGIKKLFIQK
jgi:hypothetical protein